MEVSETAQVPLAMRRDDFPGYSFDRHTTGIDFPLAQLTPQKKISWEFGRPLQRNGRYTAR
jgi:hypothetical protein